MDDQQKIQLAVNSLTAAVRAEYASSFGQTSNSKRSRIYDEFGYPTELRFDDYYRAYDRNALAGAAVDRMCDDSWQDFPEIFEGTKAKDAEGMSAWDTLINKLMARCWPQIVEADRRNLVGRYSALLIQLRDGLTWDQAVDTTKIRSMKDLSLVRLIPAWEGQVDVESWEENPLAENFGQPTMYFYANIPVTNESITGPSVMMNVHPQRIIILSEGSADGLLTSGRSLLRKGFNKLLDTEKVSGGASEGFLKNASRQLAFNFSKDTKFDKLAKSMGVKEDELADAMNDQVKRLNRNTDAAAFTQEGSVQVLSATVADPEPTWRTAISEFCATIKIPVKILIGQFTGERASTEDAKSWGRVLMSRRNAFLTSLIKEITNRFIFLGVLAPTTQGDITVSWSDLLAPSQEEKVDNMDKLAGIAQKSQQAFGRPVIKENEIRAAGEMETLDEFNDVIPPDPNKKRRKEDPLADDGDSKQNRDPDNPQQ